MTDVINTINVIETEFLSQSHFSIKGYGYICRIIYVISGAVRIMSIIGGYILNNLLDKISNLTKESTFKEIEDVIEYDFKQERYEDHLGFIEQCLSDGSTLGKEVQIEIRKINCNFKYSEKDNSIKNWLRNRIIHEKIDSLLINQYGKDYYKKLTKKMFDCDSCDLTKSIFRKLCWNDDYIDTINSFWTVYKNMIKKEYSKTHYSSCKDLLSLLNNFEDYNLVNNSESLQYFAKATHMLGNFMPCPQNFNYFKGEYNRGFDDRLDLVVLWLTGNYKIKSQEDYYKRYREDWKKFLWIMKKSLS